MENLMGLLRIHVRRGVNLAIRDATTSDPYVMVRMGKQIWRSRGYERVDGPSGRRRMARAELGSGRRKRFTWRIEIKPKLKFLNLISSSPKRFLVWLRDVYVNMMLGFASNRGIGAAYGGVTVNGSFGRGPLKEYDEKMIIEIYKSLMMAQVHRDAPWLTSTATVPKLAAIVE